jgi:hypothetical protein
LTSRRSERLRDIAVNLLECSKHKLRALSTFLQRRREPVPPIAITASRSINAALRHADDLPLSGAVLVVIAAERCSPQVLDDCERSDDRF